MNTQPPHGMDLETRLRARYRQPRVALPDSETLWARLAPHLDERALPPPHAEDAQGLHHLLNHADHVGPSAPLPAPTAPPDSHQRFFVGLPALAATLVVVLLVGVLFGFFTRAPHGASGPASVPDRSQMTLYSLSMVSSDEGWAVGNTWSMVNMGSTTVRLDAGDPIILHYLHGRWSSQPLPDYKSRLNCGGSNGACPPFALYSVSMASTQEGWAVGSSVLGHNADGVTFPLLLHYTGGKWVEVDLQNDILGSIFLRSANEGWAIGQVVGPNSNGSSEIFHYDGQSWTPVFNPGTFSVAPSSIFGTASGDLWITGTDSSRPVGDGEDGNEHTALLHYDGTHWSKVDPHIANGRLYSFAFTPPNEGWAVGMQPNTDQHKPTEEDGLLLHFHNGVWEQPILVKDPFGQSFFSLSSVAMASANEGWAVGEEGVILHYAKGTWERAQSPTSEYLSSITMVSASEGWAVGDHGVILHEQNGTWSLYHGS